MKLTVIIPALNEEKAFPRVLADLKPTLATLPYVNAVEIIVGDNGSTDRTAEVVRAADVKVVTAVRRGYGSACLAAMAAMSPETDVVLFMDGDYSDFSGDVSR